MTDYTIEDFDDISCYSVIYSLGDRGLRTIYNTKKVLWEESIEYGNPMFGQMSKPVYTVFVDKLPIILPKGATHMEDDDYFGKYIYFEENILEAFIFAEHS
jgi:hypothetical protein